MSLAGFLCLPLFYIVTLADTLLSASAEKSSTKVFTDPCAAPLTEAPPRMLHGAGGEGVLSDIALALGSMACIFLIVAHVNCSWVRSLGDESQHQHSRSFNVKEAQQSLSALPMIVVVNISFSLCYNSMNNAFPSQACQMDVRLGSSQFNGAFYNISDALAIAQRLTRSLGAKDCGWFGRCLHLQCLCCVVRIQATRRAISLWRCWLFSMCSTLHTRWPGRYTNEGHQCILDFHSIYTCRNFRDLGKPLHVLLLLRISSSTSSIFSSGHQPVLFGFCVECIHRCCLETFVSK